MPGKRRISPAGLAGMTSQYPDKDLDQWKDEPDQKSMSSSLGKEEISPTGLVGVTSQHPDKDQDQWKGEPDQKSLSPSLGKDTMSPIELAGVTSQCPDKDLDVGLTYLHQLNAARRGPQCYGSLFMQRKRKRMQHPQPSKQTHIKTSHSLPAAAMGLAEEEKVSAVETLTEEQPATKKGKRFGWFKYCSKKKQTEDNLKNDQDTDTFQDILMKRTLLKDVRMLSTNQQTSTLESYHAVINHFAPKLMHFSYKGMKNRLMLSALHFNETVWRKQAATRNRAFRYREEFPKYKKGAYIVKKVLTSHTYSELFSIYMYFQIQSCG
ncbi:hypothetical protein EOD39_7826 [Acipenser ruthenus]|uniref:Uncharacterized protein n=1 Tax=Acipenser ruthenus TaxID=7906 RepID=A0A444U5U1_ACIRT|nr:hypothetical protein EOD39_7826 [Acipenser ruthenus]